MIAKSICPIDGSCFSLCWVRELFTRKSNEDAVPAQYRRNVRIPSLLAIFLVMGQAFAQTPYPTIERIDPALDAIVSVNAKLDLVGEHFGTTEGPVWVQQESSAFLLFSDIPANVIYKWSPDDGLSVFLEKSGFTGVDSSNVGAQSMAGRLTTIVLGSNGLALDPQGRVVMATHGDRNIVRLERDGTRTVLADRYEGKRFSGPNDLVVKSNGALFFTDTQFGLRGGDKSPAKELPFYAVYLVKDGKVTAVDRDPQGGAPNGIALSPDEKSLYVGSAGKIIQYEIQSDDTLRSGRVVIEASTDGMKVDQYGNFYLTSGRRKEGYWFGGAVTIVSPQGKRLGMINLPEVLGVGATSVAFGDEDRKTLYITARGRVYRIRLNVAGGPVTSVSPTTKR